MNDGQVIIETGLDTTGIVKDVEKASKKISDGLGKNVTKTMNEVQRAVNKVSFSKIAKEMQSVDKAIDKTNSKIQEQKTKLESLKKAYENSTNVKQQNKLQNEITKVESSIAKLETRMTSLGSKKLGLENIKSSLNGLDGNFKSASVSINNSLDKVEKKAQETGRSVKNSMDNLGDSVTKVGSKISGVGDTLNRNVTLPLVGAGIAAIKVGNDFEYGMSRVEAISGATGEEMKKLHDQALDLGATTAFSAKQTAAAMEALASSGFTTNEIMKSMPGLLDLAASSGESLASSADIAAGTLRGFGLEADKAGHVADVLAKNASATSAAVNDTGEAMKYVAPAAHAAGLSLEEVTAAIGIMSDSQIKGSQAGTTLRSALTRLASPADDAKKAMQAIGFQAFDAQGKMLPLKNIIDNLTESLKGKTDQQKQDYIATIFGQEAMSGMLTLIDAGGGKLDSLTQSYKNADGAAAEMAKTMQDNAKSKIEQMVGSLETASIKVQEGFAPVVIELANNIGELADQFSKLSPEQQKFYVELLAGAAAAAPLLKLIGGITSGIGGLIKVSGSVGKLFSLGTVAAETGAATTGMSGLLGTLGALTPALIPVVGGFAGLGLVIAGVNTAQDQMQEKLTKTTDDMTEWQKAINGMTGYTFKSKKELQDLGIEYKDFGEKIGDEFKKKVEDATESINRFQLFLGKINLDGIIDEAESSDFNSQIEKMVNDAINTINSKKAETQKSLSDMFKLDDGQIDEAEQKTLDSISQSFDKQVSEEEQLKKEIIAIKEGAVARKEELNQQEIADIQKKVNRIKEIELEAVGGNQEEKDYAKNEFSARVESVSTDDASKLLQEKKKALDEENVKIKASYDTQLDMLKRNLENSKEADKAAIQTEIDKFTKLRDEKTKLRKDEMNEYLKILKQKNPEALALINEFTMEELTKADKEAQYKLTAMKATYEGLSNIVKSGTYELENTQTHSMETVTVTVDEGTGKIIGAYSETSKQVGGYTQKMSEDTKNLGQEHELLAAKAQQALNDLGSAHIDNTGKIINASGQAVGALEEVTTAADGTVTGIYDLNGTPIQIETNADGTIKNMEQVQLQIEAIPKNPKITFTVNAIGIGEVSARITGIANQIANAGISSKVNVANKYTGSNIGGFEGLTHKDEHGWEMTTGENELYYVGGGTGILDHSSSVNAMRNEVSEQVGKSMSAALKVLLSGINQQNKKLEEVANNTGDILSNDESYNKESLEALKLNTDAANSVLNKMNGTAGNFSLLQSQLDNANKSVNEANNMKVDESITNENERKLMQLVIDARKESAEKEQKIAEDNKNKLVKIAEATANAIKTQLEAERDAAEKVINDKISKLTDKYNSKISALDEESKDNSRNNTKEEYENSINVLKAKMNNTSSQADKDSLALQIKAQQKELDEQEEEWSIEDEKAQLQEEYEAKKENYEKQLKETDEYYNKLLESDSINAQARYVLLNSSNEELVQLLNSYAPDWQNAGQSLADSLLTGLNSQKQSVSDAVSEIVSLRGVSATNGGYATGTSYNKVAGFYEVDELGSESVTNGSVAYVTQGAAIKNRMQTLAEIKTEISKQVANIYSKLQASVQAEQSSMKALLLGGIGSNTSNSKVIHNDNGLTLHIEKYYQNTEQDAEQLGYEMDYVRRRNSKY